jgi:hypothetical protein
MAILPSEHAARLLEYYIRALVERSGLRWTEANSADFDRLGELLAQVDEEPADEIPPYERPIVSDRRTLVLERDPVDAAVQEARAKRWRYDEANDVRRLVRR